MRFPLHQLSHWVTRSWAKRARSGSMAPQPIPLDRPNLHQLAQAEVNLPAFVRQCAVAMKYLRLLGPLDWDHFPERAPNQAWPGPQPRRRAPFVAAYLVKLQAGQRYMSDLRTYLVEHPALVWLLGFELVPETNSPYGFAVEASLPSTRHFLTVLRTLDNTHLQFLLESSLTLIRQALPPDLPFGQVISLDTKHILAWVKENNPKVFIKEGRYDKNNPPAADRDCKLGVKRRRNQKRAAQPSAAQAKTTPTKDPQPPQGQPITELYWGYASGIVVTVVPDWGEVVLAELTQTFDKGDLTYFFPLMAQVERRLGFCPPYGALDAAFDAFYVYAYFHQAGGFAAVPLSERGGARQFDDQGLPLCQAGLAMPVKNVFTKRTALVPHQQARHACPLLYPQPNGQVCPLNHKRWPKGGCVTTLATSIGARLRHQLDRDSDRYKLIYKQRSATERLNAQAKALGIERPKLRNQRAITNQNTLIYVLLNLRTYQRIRSQQLP